MSEAKHIKSIRTILPGKAQRAVIREDECIGCTKCIPTCPTDAILGSRKQMHTVITDACTGCELCVAPCPVDCIDIVPLDQTVEEADIARWQSRYEQHQKRPEQRALMDSSTLDLLYSSVAERQSNIQDALARVKRKKDGS